jgi:TubC N-terminal docking domain
LNLTAKGSTTRPREDREDSEKIAVQQPYCAHEERDKGKRSQSSRSSQVLDKCLDIGVRLWVDGDKLRCDAPHGTITSELRDEIARNKTEIINHLTLISQRWGPSATSADPPIVVPHDWRSVVASWDHERWSAWRARAGELLATRGDKPTVEEIRTSERMAFLELATDAERLKWSN